MSDASRIRTSHAEMSFEQVAEALPGTGEVMRSVSACFAMSWHAAKGGNWDLGAYYLRRTRSLLRGLVVANLLDQRVVGIDQAIDQHAGLIAFRNPPAAVVHLFERTVVGAFGHKGSGGRVQGSGFRRNQG